MGMEQKNNPLVIKVSHSIDRIKDFFRFHLKQRSFINILYLIVFIITIIVSIVLFAMSKWNWAILLCFVAIITLLFRSIMYRITINKLSKSSHHIAIHYILTFFDEQLQYQTGDIILTYTYSKLDRIYETKHYYYFYISKNKALILPKGLMLGSEKDKLKAIINYNELKIHKPFWF